MKPTRDFHFLRSIAMVLAIVAILSAAVFQRPLPNRSAPSGLWGRLDRMIVSLLSGEREETRRSDSDGPDGTDEKAFDGISYDIVSEKRFPDALRRESLASPSSFAASFSPSASPFPETAQIEQVGGMSQMPEVPEKPVAERSDEISDALEGLRRDFRATEIRLQRWGSSGKLFRFSCCVPHPEGLPGAKKHFESLDGDPARSIATVVTEIQSWIAE